MTTYLYVATAIGLTIAAHGNGTWHITKQVLPERALTSVAAANGIILVGTEDGVWRSSDNGDTWNEANQNLAIRYVRWLARPPESANLFLAGTEPASIFISPDGGKTWRHRPEVSKFREAYGWFLPYSHRAGCIRGFAFAQSGPHPARIYAAAEVGGVLVSNDGANTWHMAEGSDGNPRLVRDLGRMVHPDVHSITVHPSSSNLVTAATGGGLYRSNDGGRSWQRRHPDYVRAVWVDPADVDHLIAGPAEGVSHNGRIEVSQDGGRTWEMASEGLQAPWPEHMVERFLQVDDALLAVLSNGELWAKALVLKQWRQILPEVQQISAVAAATYQQP